MNLNLYYPELTPIEITTPADLAAIDLKEAPVLVTFKDIKLSEADGTATYAPGDEGSVKRYFTYADGTQSGSNLIPLYQCLCKLLNGSNAAR